MLVRRRSILKAAIGVVAGAILTGVSQIVPAGRRPELLRAGPAAIRKWDAVYLDDQGRVRGALAASEGVRIGYALDDAKDGVVNVCVDGCKVLGQPAHATFAVET